MDHLQSERSRRTRIGMVTTALLMAISTAADAQTHPHPAGTSHDHHHGLQFAHPLFAESVSPDTELRLHFGHASEHEADESEVEVEVGYALGRSLSLEIGLPYVVVASGPGGSESNIANLELTLRFANFVFEKHGVLLGYGLGVGFPSGNSVKGIGSDHIWEVAPFLSMGFQRGRFEFVGHSLLGLTTNQHDGEALEREFHYDVSSLYRFSNRMQGLVELNGEMAIGGHEAGEGVVAISPGIKVAPVPNRALFIGLGASFPLNEEKLGPRLRVSTFYHF